jgi:outer membrane protein OmpA-like peptidoglycan-associated protein
MEAPTNVGTESYAKETRPWLRANARYMFDRGTNFTPFVGVEVAYALTSIDVDPAEYYRDYAINTGDMFLGSLPSLEPSTASFTRGNYPVWEGAFVAGVRFGRHGAKPAAKPKPVTTKVEEPKAVAPVIVPEQPDRSAEEAAMRLAEEEARRAAEEARRAAEEQRMAAEEARRQAEEARRAAEEARTAAEIRIAQPVTPKPVEQPPAAATESLADQIKREGFKSLMVHFSTSSFSLTENSRAAIDKWVKEVWVDGRYATTFNPNQLLIVGHCDETGEADVNRILSENRARAVANYLRDRHKLNVTNLKGLGQSKPIHQNLAENRYGQLTLNSDDNRNAEFKEVKVAIRGPLVH